VAILLPEKQYQVEKDGGTEGEKGQVDKPQANPVGPYVHVLAHGAADPESALLKKRKYACGYSIHCISAAGDAPLFGN
jgi:hypothetical protein